MLKNVCLFLTLGLLFVFTATAQVGPPIFLAVAIDTLSQKVNQIGEKTEKTERPEMKRKENWRDLRGAPWEKMKDREHEDWNEWRHGPKNEGFLFHPLGRFFLIPAMFGVACLFILIVVNILLTVLVSIDMIHRRQFNGLWIPVLLLMGVPGTGLYALFRIGDNIKAKEQRQ